MFKCIKIFVVLLLPLFLYSCEGEPLFDYLEDSRLKVVIKGTYASNSPRDWVIPSSSVIDDDYTDDNCKFLTPEDYPGDYDNSFPSAFMLDVSEIRANGDKFANYRCLFNNPLNDSTPFFSGEGVNYQTDDVFSETTYTNVELYIRKTLFDRVNVYQKDSDGNWERESDISYYYAIFNEKEVVGWDFNLDSVLTSYDFLKENRTDINRVFPLSMPIVGNLVTDSEEAHVLEIRFMVKNFLRKYEYLSDSRYYHYFGVSDWLWDIHPGDLYRGGNLFAVARAYIPEKTATISGTGGTANAYVVAIPDSEDIQKYVFPSDRRRPHTEFYPILSGYSSGDFGTTLSYMVDREKYQEDYYFFAQHVNVDKDYESTWDEFNTRLRYTDSDGDLNRVSLPPIAAWTTSGNYSLTNVPAGTYNIYVTSSPSGGEMPEINTTPIGTVTIDESDFNTTVTGP